MREAHHHRRFAREPARLARDGSGRQRRPAEGSARGHQVVVADQVAGDLDAQAFAGSGKGLAGIAAPELTDSPGFLPDQVQPRMSANVVVMEVRDGRARAGVAPETKS